MIERILNFFGWRHFRAWRHANGDHRLCRVKEVPRLVGRDYGPEVLSWTDDDGVIQTFDVTFFGGRPVYRGTEVRHW